MAEKKKGGASRVAVWIILGLLILGLAGFGAGGLGGTIAKIGNVGKTEITVQEYQEALQQEINLYQRSTGQSVTLQQAVQLGLDVRARERLAATAALTEEARIMGLSVGNDEVLRQLQAIPAFQGASGFNPETYRFTLERSGLRPQQFEESLRQATARSLVQQAVVGGLTVSPNYAGTLYNFLAERRTFRWAEINDTLLVGAAPTANDADLQAYYDENGAEFETPEVQKLTYIWLTPNMLVDEITPSEGELQALYEERAADYNQPERRLVERLSFPSIEDAEAAYAAINSGDTAFDALVEERGLTLEDVDQGEVSRDAFDSAVADVIFALTEPGITAPVDTNLGPTIYRINAVLEAQNTPFEDVRDELSVIASLDQAQRDILDRTDEVDDLLVGGATLEEIADETGMELGQTDYTSDLRTGIAGYEQFRAIAAGISEGDFPEIQQLSDGGIFAVRLDEIVPPQVPPFADVSDDVATSWDLAQTSKRLADLAENLSEQLKSGVDMEALGLTGRTETDLSRSDFIEDAPISLLINVFDLEANGITTIEDGDRVILVELLDISAPDKEADEAQAILTQLSDQGAQGMAADVFQMFSENLRVRHGLSLDQVALNAVHASLGAHGGGY